MTRSIRASIGRAATSSVFLARLRVLPRESRLCRAIVAFDRACHRAVVNRFGASPEEPSETEALARVVAVMASSRVMAFLGQLSGTDGRAWRSSWVGAHGRQMAEGVQSLEPWQRVRLAGVVVIVATAVDASIRAFGDMGWWPATVSFWATGLAAGTFMVVGCRQVAAAWATRRSVR